MSKAKILRSLSQTRFSGHPRREMISNREALHDEAVKSGTTSRCTVQFVKQRSGTKCAFSIVLNQIVYQKVAAKYNPTVSKTLVDFLTRPQFDN